MTASSEHNPSTISSDTGLPSAWEILLYSLTLTKRYAQDIYGFAAYLLFPILLSFGTQHLTGALGELFTSIVSLFFILTACWIHATMIITVSMRTASPQKDPDPRSVGLYATSILGTLTLTMLLSFLLQIAGYILIIPGIIASVFFAFAAQEVVLHGAGPLSALAASRAKVQPQFFPVFWRLAFIFFTIIGIYLLCVAILLSVASIISGIEPMAIAQNTPAWLDAVITVMQIVFLPPLIIGQTVLYLSLNTTPKESLPS